jgi:DNA-directed RNA polymerase specialized sigma24 family protein
MNDERPIANWLNELRAGDSVAAQQLWEAYYQQLVVLARRRLGGRAGLGADEEDVALSALNSFCKAIQEGRYPQIDDPGNLWKLLMRITLHKVYHLLRKQACQKRGGGWRQFEPNGQQDELSLLSQLVGREPSPFLVAQFAEHYERLMRELPDAALAEIAVLRMEGYSNAEIAIRVGKTERTIERKLNLVRRIWEGHLRPAGDASPDDEPQPE